MGMKQTKISNLSALFRATTALFRGVRATAGVTV